jgi:hypothetical protein
MTLHDATVICFYLSTVNSCSFWKMSKLEIRSKMGRVAEAWLVRSFVLVLIIFSIGNFGGEGWPNTEHRIPDFGMPIFNRGFRDLA